MLNRKLKRQVACLTETVTALTAEVAAIQERLKDLGPEGDAAGVEKRMQEGMDSIFGYIPESMKGG